MGETGCSSNFCVKSKKRNCNMFTNEDREHIFQSFWALQSWESRKSTVAALTSIKSKTQIKNSNSTRGNPVEYHLKRINGTKLQVCKEMFCSTLGISKRTMSDWLACGTEKNNENPEDKDNKTPKRKFTDEEIRYFKQWLLNVDCVDSHYCRSSETYKDKRFLEPGTSQVRLHDRYSYNCQKDGVRSVCLTLFKKYSNNLNLSIFRPRKEQCDLCVGYRHGNVQKHEHDRHIEMKCNTRTEKDSDTTLAKTDRSMSVWKFDTQSVIMCPQTKASALYYRTKLQVHNFTLYNNVTHAGYCYYWDETDGGLKAENFIWLQYNHFISIISSNPHIKKLVLWSDGCLYQNKNNCLANSYLQLAMEHKIDIFQKYLVVGHTQMECDSMHSTIEGRMVCDLYTPNDLRIVMETARRNPEPYNVKQVYFTDFKKMSELRMNSIRPGREAGDSVVTQLSHIYYTPSGKILYKLFHETEDWRPLPVRIANTAPGSITWQSLYSRKLPITKRKYDDLQHMKKVLPTPDHSFYDNLDFEQ